MKPCLIHVPFRNLYVDLISTEHLLRIFMVWSCFTMMMMNLLLLLLLLLVLSVLVVVLGCTNPERLQQNKLSRYSKTCTR